MIELNGPGDPIRECEFLMKNKNNYLFIYLIIILKFYPMPQCLFPMSKPLVKYTDWFL